MSKQYWQGFGQVNDPENFQKKVTDEFREELPFEDLDGKGLMDAKAPRRDFLKYLGFSTAAAVAAASRENPVNKTTGPEPKAATTVLSIFSTLLALPLAIG